MNTYSVVRSTLALSILVFGSRAANAACVISGVRPTVPLPTMEVGQQFSFIASGDCERLRFRVPGTEFVAIPKSGPDLGSSDRTYKVVLTQREWNSVVDESDTTFTWSIIGTTSAGVTTRVTTTLELDIDQDVTLDLSLADAKLVGEEAYDVAGGGQSVSGAGDVNGDGRDDVIVGASGNDEGGTDAGAAYLVLGPVSGTLDLSLADAKLVGEQASDYASNVSGAGDMDGDGHDDVLVGAGGNGQGGDSAGAAYLVLGPITGTLDLSRADAKLVGEEVRDYTASVSGAGDVDGDGHDDLLFGAAYNDEGGRYAGAAYLVLGPVTGTLDLALADAKLVGEEARDYAGTSVSGAGDVDGDGNDDLLVGAHEDTRGSAGTGAAYLVLGPVSATLDLSLADAKLVGETTNDNAGRSVSGAGDVNGDGHDDLLIGALWNFEGGFYAGAAYLVLGAVTGTLDLSLADAKLVAEEREDGAGNSVSDAGDVDGDGHDDLLVGAPGNDEGGSDSAGAAYVVLGPVTGTLDLAVADAKLVGEEASDGAGSGVSGAGDVDGDGRDDLLVGASGDDSGGSAAGVTYLIYGGGLF